MTEARFYYPYPRFPSVSVTGGRCWLNCKHCNSHYLAHMPDTSTPEKLKRFAEEHAARGGVGILVSGGSTPEGKVPLEEYVPTLRWVKENTGLIVNVHPGILDRRGIEDLASAGVDAASVDVVGSDETIRGVYGLNATVGDYEATVHGLNDAGVPVAPHVCIGLDFGRVRGEERALEIAASIRPEVIVLIALIPTAGTAMEGVRPPSVEDVVAGVEAAKRLSPGSEVSLGCMHSRVEKLRLEAEVLRAGATRITLPGRRTVALAEESGMTVKHLDSCCFLPRSLEERARRLGSA